MSRYVIAGGTGLIGSALAEAISERGDEVAVLSRSDRIAKGKIRYRKWDGRSLGAWAEEVCGAEAVINLSGDSVMQSWYGSGFDRIRKSRIESTLAIRQAIDACGQNPPGYWLNGSAIGYYGDRGDEPLQENSGPGDGADPLVKLAMEWEAAAATAAGIPVGLARTAIVLSDKGGSLKPMAGAARSWIAGGHLGSGRQYVSWIHLDDLVALLVRAIDGRWNGPINASSPEPVRNHDFAATLRKVVGRPWAPPVPGILIEAVTKLTGIPLNQALASTRVEPVRAIQAGFSFRYLGLESALRAELRR